MAAKELPAQDVLLQLLSYNPETGKLYWKERDVSFFAGTPARTAEHAKNQWNAKNAGAEAFTCKPGFGHQRGRLLGVPYMAHRLIWKMLHGTDPVGIDHINGNPEDNRIANLREAAQSANSRNACRRADNKSGFSGIRRRRNSWVAQITIDGVCRHIEQGKCLGRVLKARKAAECTYGFHPNHGRNGIG